MSKIPCAENKVPMNYELPDEEFPNRAPPMMAAFFISRAVRQQSASNSSKIKSMQVNTMTFFNGTIDVLQTLVIALGTVLGIWDMNPIDISVY